MFLLNAKPAIVYLCFIIAHLSYVWSSLVAQMGKNVGDLGSVPELGRSPGVGHGNPFQYSCLENPMDRGAWQATVHGITESQT